MKRIAIVGSSGAGKSTFARQLGAILDIPVTHLDAFYWQPGWIATPRSQWNEIMERLIEPERWIIDGNYSSTMEQRMSAADTIIMLDFPRLLCLYRAFKRRFQFAGKSRPDMAEGCPERIDWNHFKWIWSYPYKGRVIALKAIESYAKGREVVILRSPVEVSRFLNNVQHKIHVLNA